MTTWCQNIKCADKKNQNQIRGNKGSKYYQSNKANKYYEHWCSESCRKQWFSDHATVCLNAVGEIDRQIVPCDDAWYVQHDYRWGTTESNDLYSLCNKLKGVKRTITRQQAQTPEQISNDYNWQTIDDTQARELAVSLGLVS
jgi:hypothetical protein